MKDLPEILKKTNASFANVKDDYEENLDLIKSISTIEDLSKINDKDKLNSRLLNYNHKSVEGKIGLERILGKNNLMDISFFQKGLKISKTVCRMVYFIGEEINPLGTGFLIGEKLLMTNNHVIENQTNAKRIFAQFDYEKNENGTIRETVLFKLDPQTFFITNKELDYTVVALEPIGINNPKIKLEVYGWNKLSSSTYKPFKGEHVSIIQHPKGLPKMIAMRDNIITAINENLIHYTTDTQQGSSGSLVANDQWEIIALHREGVPKTDKDGNILLDKGGIWRSRADNPFIIWIANQGVLIDSILTNIKIKQVSEKQKKIKNKILENFNPDSNQVEFKLPERRKKF